MAIIARQHRAPGDIFGVKDGDYTPLCAWADDCLVQWGRGGLVFSPKGNYTTAFFEAFPADRENAGGFIRGEGKDLKEAEEDAFKKYTRQKTCNGKHQWSRQRNGKYWLNGYAHCRVCGAGTSGIFEPVIELGSWRKPVAWWEYSQMTALEDIDDGDREWREANPMSPELVASIRRMKIRARLFGVEEKPNYGDKHEKR